MIDWSKTALLFPGQGSQVVGMGAEIAAHHPNRFELADKILGWSLSKLCFEGPEESLNETHHTQPALYVTCLAILEAVNAQLGELQPAMLAGHSLGEITALVAGGAIAFEDGLILVRERGRLMHEAGQKSPGAMAAVIGLDIPTIRLICQDIAQAIGKPLVVANDNCPGQVVISGDDAAIDRAIVVAQEKGAGRAVKLAVSVAAHSPLMAHSAAEFKRMVEKTPIISPQIPIIGNTTANLMQDEISIRDELNAQLTGSVRWTETIQFMIAQGITTFIEIGPKGVLKGLLRRIDRNVTGLAIEKPSDIATLI